MNKETLRPYGDEHMKRESHTFRASPHCKRNMLSCPKGTVGLVNDSFYDIPWGPALESRISGMIWSLNAINVDDKETAKWKYNPYTGKAMR